MRSAGLLVLAIAVIAWTEPLLAQQSVGYASVGGRVTDPSGAVVNGAEVIALQTETGTTLAVLTDGEGRFRFPYLGVGHYEVTIRQQGFRDATRSLELEVGGAFELPIVLSVAEVNTSLTVIGQATVLDAARSQIAGIVPRAEIQNLPMNGRNFLELALLVPGVSPTNVASTQLFPETSAVPGLSLSVGSQRNLSNSFTVDGMSANDDAAALSSIAYSVDAVEQFQVVTSGAQPELGRALGGYINIVTKSGTNAVRGSVYDYVRDDRFNAPNTLSGTTLPMRQSQYGGNLGGPIVSNRTFYFANVEQRSLDQSGLVTISTEDVNAINAELTTAAYQAPLVSTGLYPNPVDSTNVLAKIDHHLSGGNRLSLRYSLYDVSSSNSRGAGGTGAPSAASDLDNLDQTIAVSSTMTLSDRTVLETRGQVTRGDLKAPPTDETGPAVSILGVASFGRLSTSPTGRLNTMYQAVNNLSHHAGAHAFRVGVDFLYNDDLITFPRAVQGTYAFSSMPNFLAGVYNASGFTQTFGETEVSQTNPNLGVYVQDEWKVNSQVTLNAGLRYDVQFLDSIDTDTNNVSPRVGVAWAPSGARRTVIRGNAGVFFDRVPLRAVANALLSAGNTTEVDEIRQFSLRLSPAQAGAPAFPNILSAPVPSVTLPDFQTIDRGLQNAHSRQASIQLEQAFGEDITIGVGYHYLRGSELLMQVNQNVATCAAAGTNNGCRPNSSYQNDNQYSPVGESNYHGLQLSFVQRPARWGQYRVSYTLSKSMNNVGEFFFSSPIDPLDLSRDWGRSDDDQRHRLVINGTIQSSMDPSTTLWEHLSHGFLVSGTLFAYSALPLNITSGVTSMQGTQGRPLADGTTPTPLDVRAVEFIPRNSGVGSDFFSLNVRVSRMFRVGGPFELEALVEGFNLTNRQNVLTLNANFGPGAYPSDPSPTFRQITAVGDPRIVQLGLRMRF